MLEGSADSNQRSAVKSSRLLGTDLDAWVATIAKMNMFIHGDGKTNIKAANGLTLGDLGVFDRYKSGLSGKADVVLTNPPLGNTSYMVAAEHWKRSTKKTAENDTAQTSEFLMRLGVVPMRIREKTKLVKTRERLDASEKKVEELQLEIATLEARLSTGQTSVEGTDQHELAKKQRALKAKQTRVKSLHGDVAKLEAALRGGQVSYEPRGTKMKGGALFLGAVADYLNRVRAEDEVAESKGGWCGIVLDEAMLNSSAYRDVRRFTREKFYVKAVVSLGRDAFTYLAHTDAKTSVLLLVRKPEDDKEQIEPIFFAHAEHVGYSSSGTLVENELPEINRAFNEVRGVIRGCYRAHYLDKDDAVSQIRQLDGYGGRFLAGDCGSGGSRLDYFSARTAHLAEEATGPNRSLKKLGDYLEVAARQQPASSFDGRYSFATINRVLGVVKSKGPVATMYSPKDLWTVRAGDLIVSRIDAVKGAVAVAGDDVDGHVMSKEMYGYAVKDPERASAVYLGLLLRAEATLKLVHGITTGVTNRTRLESPEHLLDLVVPELPSIEVQKAIAAQFNSAIADYDTSLATRDGAEAQAAGIWSSAGGQQQ